MKHHFFRFYGRTDEEIGEFLKELVSLGFKPLSSEIVPADRTCNMFVPPELHPVKQLSIYLSAKKKAELMQSKKAKCLYLRWSTKSPVRGAKLRFRQPGDPAFQV